MFELNSHDMTNQVNRGNVHQQSLAFLRVAIVWTILLSVVVSSCAVRLAPTYDRSIVDGLTTVNVQTLTLFASVSSGVTSATFANREGTYNDVIGKFDALRIQAAARPTPRSLAAQIFGSGPNSDTAPKNIEVLEAPTPAVIATIVRTITTMRDSDKASGLTPTVVSLFKGEFEISIDQALVYEKALER